ncbi:hypothetical protein [Hyperthermus butylicus]|uniref:Uncharacterized protein n=1 Tax=Hyperthermus butylicus (strain DSM 5456 / JCM 9403 / PLM1-5) TaxID=415426 RepID=A2BIU2_HYPBU|nr:hypothetical protein [Hyperthermus butylicus]ABM79898.1 hypothetical protein Hbut_0020 [Hyperthermus butylicus DSM 5456]
MQRLEQQGIFLLVFATDVEADILRELRFKLSIAQNKGKLAEIIMHTDPLTAPVYASLIAELIGDMLSGRERRG